MIDLAPRDRPREKLERSGVGALGDNELLAVLIGHGSGRRERAHAREPDSHARRRRARSHAAPPRPADETCPGIGPRAGEPHSGGRRARPAHAPRGGAARPQFLGPSDIAAYLLPQFGAHPVERFGVMLLDTRHRLISARLVSVGSLDASVANPREIYPGGARRRCRGRGRVSQSSVGRRQAQHRRHAPDRPAPVGRRGRRAWIWSIISFWPMPSTVR